MEITHERLTLDAGFSNDLETEHLERYRFAAQFVRGLDVVDIACGSGYGSALLSAAGAKSVRGFDISPDAVAFAREKYQAPGLEYGVGDAANLHQVASGSVDCVVSFETIEHVQEDQKYVDEMHRVLRPGGIYIVSTPDRRLASTMYPIRRRPNNQYHVREYRLRELLALLRTRFDVETLAGQGFVRSGLVFWPLQVFLKGSCYALRRFGAYEFIRRVYHVGSGLQVQSCSESNHQGVARYWVAKCRKRD